MLNREALEESLGQTRKQSREMVMIMATAQKQINEAHQKFDRLPLPIKLIKIFFRRTPDFDSSLTIKEIILDLSLLELRSLKGYYDFLKELLPAAPDSDQPSPDATLQS